MRGHGFSAAARSLIEVVRMSVYVPRNARALINGLRLGDITPLSAGEIAARDAGYKPYSLETRRAWRYWAHKAGCAPPGGGSSDRPSAQAVGSGVSP